MRMLGTCLVYLTVTPGRYFYFKLVHLLYKILAFKFTCKTGKCMSIIAGNFCKKDSNIVKFLLRFHHKLSEIPVPFTEKKLNFNCVLLINLHRIFIDYQHFKSCSFKF